MKVVSSRGDQIFFMFSLKRQITKGAPKLRKEMAIPFTCMS